MIGSRPLCPHVSVLLPVRNGGALLHGALASVLSQDHTSFEVLVIDDGSSDESVEIAHAIGDERVRVLSSGGQGLAAALNVGLRAASGRYVARQDADDFSSSDRFRHQVAFLDANPSVDVLATRVRFIDHSGAPYRDAWTDSVDAQWDRALDPHGLAVLLPLTCCLIHGSVMARREALLSVGGYDERLPVAQDYDLWLRLLPEHRFAKLPDRLYTFRVHPHQVSATRRDAQSRIAIEAKLRYLQRVARLPAVTSALIVGGGRGAALYRDALLDQGFLTATGGDWDIAVFTDLSGLDESMDRLELANDWHHTRRIGNFLVRRRVAA